MCVLDLTPYDKLKFYLLFQVNSKPYMILNSIFILLHQTDSTDAKKKKQKKPEKEKKQPDQPDNQVSSQFKIFRVIT